MSVHIHLVFDDPVEGHTVAADLLRRFPDNTEVDMLDDSQAADDIDLIHQVATIVGMSESPSVARTALAELLPLWGKSNSAMQFIDQAIASLPEADPTPPHGTPRPKSGRAYLDMARPTANGSTAADIIAKHEVRELVHCPRCGANAGAWCFSKSTPSWGAGMMHAARIDLIDWRQS